MPVDPPRVANGFEGTLGWPVLKGPLLVSEDEEPGLLPNNVLVLVVTALAKGFALRAEELVGVMAACEVL